MSIFTRAGNLLISMVTQLASAATSPSSRVLRVLPLDQFGNVISGGGGAGGEAYRSPGDFESVVSTVITLDISDLPFPPLFEQFLQVAEYDGDNLVARYAIDDLDLDWSWTPGADASTGVLEVVTIANVLALLNNAVAMYISHFQNVTGAIHGSDVDPNAITATYPANTEVEGVALGADLYTQYEAHRINITAAVHTNPDNVNTIGVASPTDWASLVAFVNEFKNTTGFNDHIALTVGAVHGADGSADAVTADDASTFEAGHTFVVLLRGPERAYLDLSAAANGPNVHRSNIHFAAARTDVDTLAITGMEFDPAEEDFIGIFEQQATGQVTLTYTPRNFDFNWTAGAAGEGTLDVTGASFQAGSVFVVFIAGTEHTTKVLSDAGDAAARGKIVQLQDRDGGIQPAGDIADRAGYVQMLGILGMYSGPGFSRSPIHFQAVHQAATALDLAGHPSIADVSQILFVVQISSVGVITWHFPSISTGAFSWDAVNDRLTVANATFDVTDIFAVVVANSDRYADDPGNQLLTAITNHFQLTSDDTGTDLLPGGAQTVTDAWLDIGPVQNVYGKASASGFFQLNIGDDEGIEFRALLLEAAGGDEYPATILTVLADVVEVWPHIYRLADDIDQYVPLSVIMAAEIVGVQWQVRRLVDGAGVDAVIDAAYGIRGA